MVRSKYKIKISWIVAIILAVTYFLISIIPFIYMILNSFKGKFEILVNGVFSIPTKFDISNFITVLNGGFFHYLLNSILVLVVTLIFLLFFTACASYPLSRFKFKFSGTIYVIIIACMSIPVHITLIPIFKMTNVIGLYDTIWSLIGPYIAFGVPISVFILTSFMKGLPKEMEEAAEIDGCNKYKTFFNIILPLSTPGLSTLAIYNGVNIWNEFIFAYTLTQSAPNRTLPLAIWEYQGQYAMNIPMIMAVLSLTILPMVILFIFFQDKLVKGITAGAIKG
ncbi:MAG: carbohydrate ABC transporter permease [Peptostreptococcaceae bacterium]|nr:carbohydrate ABC transporter permease [Peptostreptococcaceae bacterium]